MCGIAGKIYFNGGKVNRGELYRMGEILKHRGPDDGGIYINPRGNVGLSHRRLAVVDLSPAGHQPMSNEDGTVWITFNGEIYNFWELRRDLERKGHKFKSNTDTEVIIHLWEEYGEECLERLRGMFAFAIWDENQQKLFLARDRTGEKPLKYYWDGQSFIFASELKAILKILPQKPAADKLAVSYFLSFNHVQAPATGFLDIYKLPPACCAVCQNGKLRIKRYWKLNFDNKTLLSYAEAKDKTVYLLEEAVRERLTADVPLGIFLSGGVDSAVVTAFASGIKPGIRTFTIGFSQNSFDERPGARTIARLFNTSHNELEIKPDATKILPRLVYQYEEPYSDSSALATFYLSEMTKKFVTVALSGDGGDEAFGGYKRYLYFKWGRLWDRDFYWTIAKHFYFKDYYKEDDLETVGNVEEALRLGFERFLADDLLTKVDIATMACSLENRAPFLDHRLLEFAASLPDRWKVGWFSAKIILKDAFKKILPREVLSGKRGFELPVDDWLRNDLYEWARDIILDRKAVERNYFEKSGLERILKEHKNGKKNHGQRVWTLICLELWHRQFID